VAAGKTLNEDQIENIKKAIGEAESKNTGEIIPLIVKASDNYTVANYRIALFFTVIFFALFCLALPEWVFTHINLSLFWPLLALLAIGHLLSLNNSIFAFFIRKKEKVEEVKQRALQGFLHHNLHHVTDHNGILIFISLLEKRIEIIADTGISQKADEKDWTKIIKKLTSDIKKGNLEQGLILAIKKCGELLDEHFPLSPDEKKENLLENKVLIED